MNWWSPVITVWLYRWELKVLLDDGEVIVHEGVFPSGLDSRHEQKEVMLEAVNKTLDFVKLKGKKIQTIFDFSYKVMSR